MWTVCTCGHIGYYVLHQKRNPFQHEMSSHHICVWFYGVLLLLLLLCDECLVSHRALIQTAIQFDEGAASVVTCESAIWDEGKIASVLSVVHLQWHLTAKVCIQVNTWIYERNDCYHEWEEASVCALMCVFVFQVDELERRCKLQQEHVFELKQELTNSTAELKLRLAQTEG